MTAAKVDTATGTLTDAQVRQLLSDATHVALLGVSPRPDDPSYHVASYLQSQGYHLAPVTAGDDAILGFPTYRSLGDVPGPVDALAVFLNSDAPPASLPEDVRRLGVQAVWTEPGCSQAAE